MRFWWQISCYVLIFLASRFFKTVQKKARNKYSYDRDYRFDIFVFELYINATTAKNVHQNDNLTGLSAFAHIYTQN